MERRRAVADRDYMIRTCDRCEPPLELRDTSTLHELSRTKHAADRFEIIVIDIGGRDAYHVCIRARYQLIVLARPSSRSTTGS